MELTSMRTVAVYISYADVKQPRSTSNGDNIERNGAVSALIQVYVHVLAGVIATDRGNYRVTGLTANNESIVLANTWARSIQIELEEVQS